MSGETLHSLTVVSFAICIAITALISVCLLVSPLISLLRKRFGQGDDTRQLVFEYDDNPATSQIDQKLLRMLVPTMVFHRASCLDSQILRLRAKMMRR